LVGHNETLQPLLRALGFDRIKKVNVSSAIFFEFVTDEDDLNWVGVNMRNDDGTVDFLELPCSTKSFSDRLNFCSADEFYDFISGKVAVSDEVYYDSFYQALGPFADT